MAVLAPFCLCFVTLLSFLLIWRHFNLEFSLYSAPLPLYADLLFHRPAAWFQSYTPTPFSTSSPGGPPVQLRLHQVLHHGTSDQKNLFLQQVYTPAKLAELEMRVNLAANREGPPLQLTDLNVRARPGVRIPYPETNRQAFYRYLQRTDPAFPSASDRQPEYVAQTYGNSTRINTLPFRYQYHALSTRRRPSFWADSPADEASPYAATTVDYSRFSGSHQQDQLPALKIPDVADNYTITTLARMTANAYSLPTDDLWFDLANDQWYQNSSFGWDSDGLRGYVYGDDKNSTIVITIKGTSARFFLGGDSETSARDKLNDNRLFSCCCARIDYSWSTVCDCYMSSGKCNQQCLEDSLQSDDLYFQAAANLFLYVSDQYPQADIWLTGHSLGGSLAGLLGLTYGQPTVGFQAPGDRLAASRLHLPVGPGADMRKMPIFHFGHNADPLFVGSCNGGGSSCYYGGYAMESKCHIGSSCIFDTVREKGWRVNIGNHRIHKVLDEVLGDESIPWPACEVDEECTDCSDWSFE